MLLPLTMLVGLSGAIAAPPEKYSGSCTTSGCHDGYAKKTLVHPPIAQDSCDACHEPQAPAEHKFRLARQGGALCTECHEIAIEKSVHEPFARGQCTACHDPHASAGPHLLLEKSVGETCAQCHEDAVKGLAFLHGPVAAGDCTACHNPHSAPRAKLLPVDEREVCTKCHSAIQERLAPPAKAHRPVTDGCLACHKPHGAGNKMMLAAVPPALCLDCHENINDLLSSAKFQHAPVKSGASCAGCHDPHGSPQDGLLIKPQRDLCLGCHNQEIADGERKIRNIGGILAANAHAHGPVGDGTCSACHNPHGGEQAGMLARAYPTKFYSPFDPKQYALCLECHEADAFAERETDSATSFRNGTVNLHFLHVNKAEKGRTCRACHEPHASNNAKHIAERVPFGRWEIPIGFKPTETGGSCMPGCHKPYAYDRERPVTNLAPPAPGS